MKHHPSDAELAERVRNFIAELDAKAMAGRRKKTARRRARRRIRRRRTSPADRVYRKLLEGPDADRVRKYAPYALKRIYASHNQLAAGSFSGELVSVAHPLIRFGYYGPLSRLLRAERLFVRRGWTLDDPVIDDE